MASVVMEFAEILRSGYQTQNNDLSETLNQNLYGQALFPGAQEVIGKNLYPEFTNYSIHVS